MPIVIGQTLENRYRIEAPLGQGGMGAVYRAVGRRAEAPVAIVLDVTPNYLPGPVFVHTAAFWTRCRQPLLT
jgi:serine/threonine-protein kinase